MKGNAMPPKIIGLRLELDAELHAMLEELSDFHGVDIQATLRLCIRHEYRGLVMDRTEADAQRHQPAPPHEDDEVPW